MRVRGISWNRRLFGRASEAWRLEIVVLASEDEIKELRKLGATEVLKKTLGEKVRTPETD